MRGIVRILIVLCILASGPIAMADGRFRVVVKVPDAAEPYVAVLKDTWGSYLTHRTVLARAKAKFEDVPVGDFNLRIQFRSGKEITTSLRVDAAHASAKGELTPELRAADAVVNPDALEAGGLVSLEELAISEKARKRFSEAWKAMEINAWQDARRILEEAIADSPAFFDAWNNLGVVARRMDDLEDAEVHFRGALRLRPNSFEANTNLAEVLSALGKTEEGIAAARRAHRIRPRDPRANAQLGVQLYLAHRYEDCLPFLEFAAQTDPLSYYYPQISLSVALEKLGRTAEAARHLEHWLHHHTTNPDRAVVEAKHRELTREVARTEATTAQ